MIIVTRKENVETEDGEILFDEDGIPALKDEEAIGMLLKTHTIQVSQIDPKTQRLETGCIVRCEVVWEHQRSPAVSMEDPEELAWLSVGEGDESSDDPDHDEETDNGEYEEEAVEEPLHI